MREQKAEAAINTALIIAALRREEIAELITRQECVLSATPSLSATNTVKRSVVVSSVEQHSDIEEVVYCLEVPTDSCFTLADGTIVSNCLDGFSYLSQMEMVYYEDVEPTREHYESRFRSTRRNPYD
jgi:hypothetical protein